MLSAVIRVNIFRRLKLGSNEERRSLGLRSDYNNTREAVKYLLLELNSAVNVELESCRSENDVLLGADISAWLLEDHHCGRSRSGTYISNRLLCHR